MYDAQIQIPQYVNVMENCFHEDGPIREKHDVLVFNVCARITCSPAEVTIADGVHMLHISPVGLDVSRKTFKLILQASGHS